MEECSVLIETTQSAEDKTSRWFDLPIDYELFRDLLGVEADSKDYQITDMKLPFAGDIVRTTSVRRLNKLYFAYTDLSPEVQQAYKELIPYCGGVEDLSDCKVMQYVMGCWMPGGHPFSTDRSRAKTIQMHRLQ